MTLHLTPRSFAPHLPETASPLAVPLTEQARFKVFHLVLRPGMVSRRESHFHRSEHWVVVSGSALVTLGERVLELYENQSLDVPVGMVHRIENHGKVDLHLIEVQTGTYLGEDDVALESSAA